jgi:MinD superfamily P-loop ATPase containing an inserted ferredoxin domain
MSIKKIIAIAATKGGVGKSTFSAGLALNLLKKYKVGI